MEGGHALICCTLWLILLLLGRSVANNNLQMQLLFRRTQFRMDALLTTAFIGLRSTELKAR